MAGIRWRSEGNGCVLVRCGKGGVAPRGWWGSVWPATANTPQCTMMMMIPRPGDVAKAGNRPSGAPAPQRLEAAVSAGRVQKDDRDTISAKGREGEGWTSAGLGSPVGLAVYSSVQYTVNTGIVEESECSNRGRLFAGALGRAPTWRTLLAARPRSAGLVHRSRFTRFRTPRAGDGGVLTHDDQLEGPHSAQRRLAMLYTRRASTFIRGRQTRRRRARTRARSGGVGGVDRG